MLFVDSDISIKLPPKENALYLLSVFEDTFCEYHWFLRRDFKDRLANTYPHCTDQTNDRNWLCRLSVVLALAQNQMPASSQDVDMRETNNAQPGMEKTENDRPWPPGTTLFNQAVQLFESSPDEPTLEDIEALNLMVRSFPLMQRIFLLQGSKLLISSPGQAFYCYSSNRLKIAFVYINRSIALFQLLSLDKPQLLKSLVVTGEHARRLRWTTYYLECMLLVELGLPPLCNLYPDELQTPSSSSLRREELDEFFDPDILQSRFGLQYAKSHVVIAVVDCWRNLNPEKGTLHIVEMCLSMIRGWKKGLSAGIALEIDEGERTLKSPCARGLASMHLSYYEVCMASRLLMLMYAKPSRSVSLYCCEQSISKKNGIQPESPQIRQRGMQSKGLNSSASKQRGASA